MTRTARLLLLVAPLAIGLVSAHAPGGAQTRPPTSGGRFAFSDTTLLRDTLNLKFDGLFPLADSLGILPDTLRALSIRYRMSIGRLVLLADSLRAPIDSVGAIMRREQFNPLSQRIERLNALHYTSSYNITRTLTVWTNGADWNFVRGPASLRNNTTITMDRSQAGGLLNLRQKRDAITESGWKFSPNLFVGARANLDRFDTRYGASSISDEAETINEFQFSTRTKQQVRRSWKSDVNLFAGVLDKKNSSEVKRGLSGDVSGHVLYSGGRWLTNDITARANGNLSRTRLPTGVSELTTKDVSNNIDGTLGLLQTSATRFNVNYGLRRVRVERPEAVTDSAAIARGERVRVQQVLTDTDHLSTTFRLQQDNDRYLDLSERLGRSSNATALNLSSLNTRTDQSLNVQGRYTMLGWFLDASFNNSYSDTRFPRRSATGGYGDKTSSRQVQAILSRTIRSRIVVKGDGRVGLTSSRYYIIGSYTNPPVDRDQYRQSYKLDGQYNRSARLTTGVLLEVSRNWFVNIPSASTGANSQTKTYRSEWRWTYQLWPGLTANQRNELRADYTLYDFLPTNNRLSLSYKTLTTMNVILTPRSTLEVTHDAQLLPSGNYTQQPDKLEAFSKSDESKNYALRARLSFAPSSLFSLEVQTDYQSSVRATITNTGTLPQRDSRTLNFAGGGTLNVPLGAKGRLTGDLRRSYRDDRSISFQAGVPQPSPRSELESWNGRLELSWDL